MIAIKLWGGVGNQLFQYAFGLYASKKLNKKLYFYLSDSTKSVRDIELLKFNVNAEFLTTKEISKFTRFNGRGLQYRIERKIVKKMPWFNKNLFIEPTLSFCNMLNDTYYLFDGYWQSYKYLHSIVHIIKSEFCIKQNLIPFLNLEEPIKNGNSISIHIRRGDYLQKGFNSIYAYCDEVYYKNAIDIICKTINNPTFYVFSNELEWVKQNLNIFNDADVVYVDNSSQENANLLDLQLMILCKHNIIANSTFSWWGAWLNTNPDKIVIAPKHWYNGELNETTNDLIPQEWIRI